jgi:hypothetical protein
MVEERQPYEPNRARHELDARSGTERLDAALRRIERIVQDFDARLAWK